VVILLESVFLVNNSWAQASLSDSTTNGSAHATPKPQQQEIEPAKSSKSSPGESSESADDQ
jgi:hypothetical protein